MSGKGRKPWRVWSQDELTTLTRLHAEGKTQAEINPHLPKRTPQAIWAKMEALGLERNYEPNSWVFAVKADQVSEFESDPWFVKVKFEDVTKAEARAISQGAPRCGKFKVHRIPPYSIYGSSIAMMVA